jgi:hypothetical protein
VKHIRAGVGINKFAYYTHNQKPNTFHQHDIGCDYVSYPSHLKREYGMFILDDKLFVNTWIGSSDFKWMKGNTAACNIENNYNMFSFYAKELGIEMEPIENFIPEINYGVYDIDFEVPKEKNNILICNGDCWSGQSHNFNFDPTISELSKKYPEKIIFVTDKTSVVADNVVNANVWVKKDSCNLNEISYLSNWCSVIIGRSSGPFCFSQTKINLKDESKVFVALVKSSNIQDAHWIDMKKYGFKNHARQISINSNDNSFDMRDLLLNCI